MGPKLTPELTPEAIEKILEKVNRKPKKPGVCDECGGNIVQRVISLYRGNFSYWVPECNDCGISYMGVESAPKVGVEEFIERMRTPCTI